MGVVKPRPLTPNPETKSESAGVWPRGGMLVPYVRSPGSVFSNEIKAPEHIKM